MGQQKEQILTQQDFSNSTLTSLADVGLPYSLPHHVEKMRFESLHGLLQPSKITSAFQDNIGAGNLVHITVSLAGSPSEEKKDFCTGLS